MRAAAACFLALSTLGGPVHAQAPPARTVVLVTEPGGEHVAEAVHAELHALDIAPVDAPPSEGSAVSAIQITCHADGAIEVRNGESVQRFEVALDEDLATRATRAAELVRAQRLVAPELDTLTMREAAPADDGRGPEPRPRERRPGTGLTAPEPLTGSATGRAAREGTGEDAAGGATGDGPASERAPDERGASADDGIGTAVRVGAGVWLGEGAMGPQAALDVGATLHTGTPIAVTARFFYQLSEPTLSNAGLSSSARLFGFAAGVEVRLSPIEILELGIGAAIGGVRFDATGSSALAGVTGTQSGAWLAWPHASASARLWFHDNVGAFLSASAGALHSRIVVALVPEGDPTAMRVTVGTIGPFVGDVMGGLEVRWGY